MENQNSKNKEIKFAFFGTSRFAVYVLDNLKDNGYKPSLIITTEDKPKGRKLLLSPSEVKVWAEKEGITFIQPKSLRAKEVPEEIKTHGDFDVFIVASYGKIIPKEVLKIPKFGTLNVHPSLLPKLRGPSPIQTSIIEENETGVTIIKLDEEVDHGPILSQEKLNITLPIYEENLEKITGEIGGEMLSKILPSWINGEIKEVEQNHDLATFTKKIDKKDAELDLTQNAELNLRKIMAYSTSPGSYYFDDVNGVKKRILVKKAHLEDGKLVLDRIIPEGKKEMNYEDYLRGKK